MELDWEFKTVTINMVRALMDEGDKNTWAMEVKRQTFSERSNKKC